jgi:hypothetical protein
MSGVLSVETPFLSGPLHCGHSARAQVVSKVKARVKRGVRCIMQDERT